MLIIDEKISRSQKILMIVYDMEFVYLKTSQSHNCIKMKRKLYSLFCLMLSISFSNGLLAQDESSIKKESKEVVFMNGQAIDPMRYEKFSGSPYWFKEWREARIISNNFSVVDGVFVNFNGDTREVEVRRGDDEFLELARGYYARIELKPLEGEGEEPLVFQRGFHPSFGDKFMQVLYRSPDVILAKEFYTNQVEPHFETIHAQQVKHRFSRTESLHLCVNGICRPLPRKSWPIIRMFDQDPAIKNYLKELKPNLKEDAELIKLIKFYESDVLGKG